MRNGAAGFVAIALALFGTESAYSQAVIAADNASLQPLIVRGDAGFSSCGVRGVVLVKLVKKYYLYDFSVSVDASSFHGFMKAGKSVLTAEQIAKLDINNKVHKERPKYFWIAEETSGDGLRPLKVMSAENEGFILQLADVAKSTEAMFSIATGKRMNFAVRYPSERLDYVVSFEAELSEREKQLLFACMDGIVASVKSNRN